MTRACPVCGSSSAQLRGATAWQCSGGSGGGRHTFDLYLLDDKADLSAWEGRPYSPKSADKYHGCPDEVCKKPLTRQGKVLVCLQHPTDMGSLGKWPAPFYWWAVNESVRARFLGQLPPVTSFSAMSLANQCLRRYKHKYLDRLPDPAGIEALIGGLVHRVLELNAPGWDRPEAEWLDLLRGIPMAELLADPELADALPVDWADPFTGNPTKAGLAELEAFAMPRLLRLAAHQLAMGRRLVATEQHVRADLGGVPMQGYIDLQERERIASPIHVTDYKSGKKPAPFYQAEYEAKKQQTVLYAALLEEQHSRPVEAVHTVYAHPQLHVVSEAYTTERRREAVDWLQVSYATVRHANSRNNWPTSEGYLCAWCPYFEHCPEGQAWITDKALAGWKKWDQSPAYERIIALPEHERPPTLTTAGVI